MPSDISVKAWLTKIGQLDLIAVIDAVEKDMRAKGLKTRRNWWETLAGCLDGSPRVVHGHTFPVLAEARRRQGLPPVRSAIEVGRGKRLPRKWITGRWGEHAEGD